MIGGQVDDRLARWMRVRGEASLEAFKDALAWILPPEATADVDARAGASETANALQLMGAADFDWIQRSWRARTPALYGVVGKNYGGFLTGLLATPQRQRLAELEAGNAGNVVVARDIRSDTPITAPAVQYLIGDCAADLEEAAQHIGCGYVMDAAMQMARSLPTLGSYSATYTQTHAPARVRLEFLTPTDAAFWSPVRRAHERGLYRLRPELGPKLFLLWTGDSFLRVHDRQVGVYEHLRLRGQPSIAFDALAARVYVPRWAIPPAPQARCLVATSGQLPRQLFDRAWPGANFYFENVPEAVAISVAASLEQDLRHGSWS